MRRTAESVSAGHPDKICDRISDAILDDIIRYDSGEPRVACETMANTGMVIIAGEITTDCYVDIHSIVRRELKNLGYVEDGHSLGFRADDVAVLPSIDEQSPDIASGVGQEETGELGAGDQGIMVGYAVRDSEDYMPLPAHLSHKLIKTVQDIRKSDEINYLKPDGKCQVTVEYDPDSRRPKAVTDVVISAQHDKGYLDEWRQDARGIIADVMGEYLADDPTLHINPAGSFIIGSAKADAGLTGRKIVVDQYGPSVPVGGGAFSGKDPTKVDRSGAYAARYLAKNILHAYPQLHSCQVEISYAIGVAEPVAINFDFEPADVEMPADLDEKILSYIDLSPRGIIDYFNLFRPIYKQYCTYGHFGTVLEDDSSPIPPWEKLDLARELMD